MEMRIRKIGLLLAIMAVLFSTTGCLDILTVGSLQTKSESVELDGAQSVRVELKQGHGSLRVTGDADTLLDADFAYNVAAWEPEVDYSVSGNQGTLTVEQPRREIGGLGIFLIGSRNEWDMRLNNNVPIALHVEVSHVDCYLELDNLSLTGLTLDANNRDAILNLAGDYPSLDSIEISATQGSLSADLTGHYPSLTKIDFNTDSMGDVKVDLTGTWKRDVDVTLNNSSFGEVALWLPSDVGVRVEATTGAGCEMDYDGLKKDGNVYTNDAYGKSAVTLRVVVSVESGYLNLALGE